MRIVVFTLQSLFSQKKGFLIPTERKQSPELHALVRLKKIETLSLARPEIGTTWNKHINMETIYTNTNSAPVYVESKVAECP
jgi:hypothetical protein